MVVGGDAILGGELRNVTSGDRLVVRAVLHDDHENVRGRGGGCGFRAGRRRPLNNGDRRRAWVDLA